MRINHNIAALNTYRQLSANTTSTSKSLEKLSSGLRINRAGDDAAGLAISEKMRGQIRGLEQASRNASDGISLIQTAEGALNETHSILQRMRELAVQAANDTNTLQDRQEIQKEINQLSQEITRISTDTEFNKKTLLNGSFGIQLDATASANFLNEVGEAGDPIESYDISGAKASTTYTISETASSISIQDGTNTWTLDKTGFSAGGTFNFEALGISIKTSADYNAGGTALNGLEIVTDATLGAKFQIGANAGQTASLTIGDMSAAALQVNNLDVTTEQGINDALTAIDNAIATVSSQRALLGAVQNRLEHTINNLGTTQENLVASESRIRDVDMAKEMMEFTKNSILSQASQAMLAQANAQPQSVLQLLQ
jgi:flagellin